MRLSEDDGKLYYKLWLPLLDYVNERYRINSNLSNMAEAKSLNPAEVAEVADYLWDHVDVIDEYLKSRDAVMESEHQAIVAGWKRRVRGRFVMERHLKKGSIFISMEDEQVYQVNGIISSWEEMFPYAPLSIIMEATFMPFKEVIISDGLVRQYPVVIGGNMKKTLKDVYMMAKKNGEIVKRL